MSTKSHKLVQIGHRHGKCAIHDGDTQVQASDSKAEQIPIFGPIRVIKIRRSQTDKRIDVIRSDQHRRHVPTTDGGKVGTERDTTDCQQLFGEILQANRFQS